MAEVENIGEAGRVKAMGDIIRHIGLENARVPMAEGAAAIKKLSRDVAHFGDVKMGGNELAVREDEARKRSGIGTEERFQFTQFHNRIYIPIKEYRQAQNATWKSVTIFCYRERVPAAAGMSTDRASLLQFYRPQTKRVRDD